MKKIISIALVMLMLASNIGFSMNTHFCAGKAVKTSFSMGLYNPNCGMAVRDECGEAESSDQQHIKPKSCCENTHRILQLDDNADVPSSSRSIYLVLCPAFIPAIEQPVLYAADQKAFRSTYYPPLLTDQDIYVLFQTFLI